MYFTEEIIEKVFEQEIESDNDPVMELTNIAADQPAIISYLGQENLELLTEEEFDYCAFLVTIIYKVYEQSGQELALIEPEQIDAAEEENWEKLNNSTGKKFSQRIDGLFEGFTQEDLLAFVEDALEADDLPIVTNEGREPMFIILKTIIDVLEASVMEKLN